jgi:hypothetical protein
MIEIDETLLFEHPSFGVYEDFLRSYADPECQDCPVLTIHTSRLAADALKKAVVYDANQDQIIGIDPLSEEQALAGALMEVCGISDRCSGPEIVDVNIEEQRERLRNFPFFTPEFLEKALERVMPVRAECGLENYKQ